jgi:hypothetical protein
MFAQVNALMYRNVDIKQHFTMVIWMLHNVPLFRSSGAKMKLHHLCYSGIWNGYNLLFLITALINREHHALTGVFLQASTNQMSAL